MSAQPFNVERRAFLRGVGVERGSVVRPPWARDEVVFLDRCDRCDDCVTACSERILIRGSGGYPEVDFSRGGCTFCGDCVTACPTDALTSPGAVELPAWAHRAQITEKCLSLNGVLCRSCGDACDVEAIRFRLMTGGRSRPSVDLDACTGCGSCRYVCPVGAVSLITPEEDQIQCRA